MARKIIWTEPALNDLDAIADTIALDKPLAAKSFVRKVFGKVELLAMFPRLGSLPPEIRGLPYRQLVVPPCRLYYRLKETTIYIVAVIRGERKFRRELLERH